MIEQRRNLTNLSHSIALQQQQRSAERDLSRRQLIEMHAARRHDVEQVAQIEEERVRLEEQRVDLARSVQQYEADRAEFDRETDRLANLPDREDLTRVEILNLAIANDLLDPNTRNFNNGTRTRVLNQLVRLRLIKP